MTPDRRARLADDQRIQRSVCDLQARRGALRSAAPDWVLVLDREQAVESALVQGIDDGRPGDLPEARDAVAPPADIPRIRTVDRLARPAVPVALLSSARYPLAPGQSVTATMAPPAADTIWT